MDCYFAHSRQSLKGLRSRWVVVLAIGGIFLGGNCPTGVMVLGG